MTTHSKFERLGGGRTRQTVTAPTGIKQVTETLNGRTDLVQVYDSANRLNSVTSYTYDEFNRLGAVSERNGANELLNEVTYSYNANGEVLTQSVNGQITSFEYDVMGRQTKVTAPGGVVTNYEYYPTGELKRVDGSEYPVEFSYDELGNKKTMKTFKDASTPQVTTWNYNNRNFLISKIYADGTGPSYTYNADGQLLTRSWVRQINGTPLTTTYSYDNAGRMTGYEYNDGVTPGWTMELNHLDQTTSVTDSNNNSYNFTYNSLNQLVNVTNPFIVGAGTTYTYDAFNRRTGMSLANVANSFANAVYTYDAIGRIATTGNNSDTVTYTYAPGTNRITSTGWQNAEINTVNTYDQFKRLTNIAVNDGNVYGYTLNDKNQRTSATLANGKNWTFEYDDLGQLTGAVFKFNELAEKTLSYDYDQIGNRTTATENNVVTNYTSNIINQYTAINQTLPTYDADGNMLTNGDWSYTWNGENRLMSAENSVSGVRIEADYDYMGRRIFKKVYNNNTLITHRKFAYDGFKLIAEFDALNSDALIANYLWQVAGLDVPLMRSANGTNDYYIVDGNKNVIELRNNSGAVTKSYAYNPFGVLDNPIVGDENPFRFSSEYSDPESGLVYYNYRYYSPTLGRWLNPDPIMEQGGLNMYGMGKNNLVIKYDSLGLYTLEEAAEIKYNASKALKDKYEKIAEDVWTMQIKYATPNTMPIYISGFSWWYRTLKDQEIFDIWYNEELKDLSWLDDLPKCPPCITKNSDGNFISPDGAVWETPTGVTNAAKFHPGAVYEIRTKKPTAKGAGNQCTYDKNGKIISTKYGCGTADRKQATRNVFLVVFNWISDEDHIGHDVTPYNKAYELDNNSFGVNVDKYISVRPFWGE